MDMYNHKEFRDCVLVAEFAKLNEFKDGHGKVIGRNKVFALLRKLGILGSKNFPMQQYLKYFKMQPKAYQTGESQFEKYIPLVTPEGQRYLEKRIKEHLEGENHDNNRN